MQEFYKLHQTALEKKLGTLEKRASPQVSTVKSCAKLGFFYEFTSDSAKALESFVKCYNALCQSLALIKKNFGIWEIKCFADAIMLKLLKIETSPKQTYERLRSHYATFKQSSRELNPGLEYLVALSSL